MSIFRSKLSAVSSRKSADLKSMILLVPSKLAADCCYGSIIDKLSNESL